MADSLHFTHRLTNQQCPSCDNAQDTCNPALMHQGTASSGAAGEGEQDG